MGRRNYDPNVRGAGEEGAGGGGGSFGRSQRKEEGIKMMTKLATGGRVGGRKATARARGGAAIMGVGNSYVPSLAFTCYVGCLMGTARENWGER